MKIEIPRTPSVPTALLHAVVVLVAACAVAVAAPPSAAVPRELRLTLAAEGWGDADRENLHAVLASAAGEIWRFCPGTRLPPIRVEHTDKVPITIFDRNPDGAVVVKLNSRGRLWAQFAYQFAHEFAHVLALFPEDGRARWKNATHANQWFEESLAEAASIFALEGMARDWALHPPYPNWKSYAVHLEEYARDREQDPRHRLAAGQPFSLWFREHEPALRTNAVNRASNTLIALQLLPLLRDSPGDWEALTAVNLGTHDQEKSFARYLAEWKDKAPATRRPFIERLGRLFGVELQ